MASNPFDDPPKHGADEVGETRLVEFDQDTDQVTETIVTTIADLTGQAPTALEPLYDVIDPEALDALVRSTATQSPPADAEITIRYHGYTISISNYGVIEFAPRQSD